MSITCSSRLGPRIRSSRAPSKSNPKTGPLSLMPPFAASFLFATAVISVSYGGSVWESNPNIGIANLLNQLSLRLRVRRIWAQNRSDSFNCLPVLVTNDMPVNPKRDACIRMAELRLRDGRCGTGREQ
jgi:hypothetical protein